MGGLYNNPMGRRKGTVQAPPMRGIQVSAKTVLNYVHTGKLRAVRLGGNGPWRIYASSVSRLLGIPPPKPKAKSRDVQDRIDLALGILGISQHQEHVDP